MKFLLNDKVCEDSEMKPGLSLLRFLRENNNLVGTKEGCASGDCGACTVLVGELVDGKTKYHSVNSCITPVQAIAGKQVLTVEHLASDDALHPSQKAMVDHSGSQCGFCTPGFVMSLTGLYEAARNGDLKIDRHNVCESISGNLCRCTGYRPIVDAGLAMDLDASSKISDMQAQVASELDAMNASDSSQQPTARYFAPTSEASLQALMQEHPQAALIAGGTDLMLEETQRYQDFAALIDLSRIPSLKQIKQIGDELSIGSAVTYAQLEHYFADEQPMFNTLFERIASRQIRNRGTIGGNIANASPIADLPPPLLALDTHMVLSNSSGETRTMSLEQFYHSYKVTELKPDEYISCFLIKLDKLAQSFDFFKVSKRIEDDISSVMAAISFEHLNGVFTTVRLAFGGMAAVPLRAKAAEASLIGQAINDSEALEQALSQIRASLSPIDDVRASAAYRLDIACSLVKKSWLKLNGKAIPFVTDSKSSFALESKSNA